MLVCNATDSKVSPAKTQTTKNLPHLINVHIASKLNAEG